jgi:hypothetical protein
VTFFTISENPWAIAGGTPAASAEMPTRGNPKRNNSATRDTSDVLRFAITSFLQKIVNSGLSLGQNALSYTIQSATFKD